jgi:uncharacterized protein YprB with RNaseH-like and TPR domain
MDLSARLQRLPPLRSASGNAHANEEDHDGAQATALVLAPAHEDLRDRSHDDKVARLRSMLDALIARHQREPITVAPPGTPFDLGPALETAHGPLHAFERILEPDHHHGRVPVASALDADPSLIADLALNPSLAGFDVRRALFLDLETTGLNQGAGTIPFLIGMAYFEDQSLIVRQLFLARPGEEEPMLRALLERIEQSSALISYNGKSFDLPLLLTRFVLHRIRTPALPVHLDLLPCARRIYKRRTGSAQLVRIEEEVLGMRRERDVEGHEIPELYWRFVRNEPCPRMALVLEHNAHDLIALAALLAKATAQLAFVRREDDPRDHFSLAEVSLRAGKSDRALAFAEASIEGGADRDLSLAAHRLRARVHLKRLELDRAEAALLDALRLVSDPIEGSPIHLRLAKLYEHRIRDHERASLHAARSFPAEDIDAHLRRTARIQKKLERSRSRPPRESRLRSERRAPHTP